MEISSELTALFVSAFIAATIAPGGSEALLAWLSSEGEYSILQLVSVASLGNTLGALTTWLLGWMAAEKMALAENFKEKHQTSINHVIKWGNYALLFSWLPVVGDGLCLAAGWLKLSFWYGLLAIVIGKVARYYFVAMAFIA